MSDINPIARPQHTSLDNVNKKARHAEEQQARAHSGGDRVQLSDQARLLSKLKQLPEVREDMVNSVKSQIDAGNYDTAERFDTAVNALLDDLTT